MRRLMRWTFNTLAAVSLLLCLATAGLWVRSYWVYDELIAQRRDAIDHAGPAHQPCFLASYRGKFGAFFGWSERPEGEPTPPWEFYITHPTEGVHPWPKYAFSAKRLVYDGYTYHAHTWVVPDWPIVSAFALLPAIFVLRQVRAVRRRRQRSRLGLCLACGYDLRATPGGARSAGGKRSSQRSAVRGQTAIR